MAQGGAAGGAGRGGGPTNPSLSNSSNDNDDVNTDSSDSAGDEDDEGDGDDELSSLLEDASWEERVGDDALDQVFRGGVAPLEERLVRGEGSGATASSASPKPPVRPGDGAYGILNGVSATMLPSEKALHAGILSSQWPPKNAIGGSFSLTSTIHLPPDLVTQIKKHQARRAAAAAEVAAKAMAAAATTTAAAADAAAQPGAVGLGGGGGGGGGGGPPGDDDSLASAGESILGALNIGTREQEDLMVYDHFFSHMCSAEIELQANKTMRPQCTWARAFPGVSGKKAFFLLAPLIPRTARDGLHFIVPQFSYSPCSLFPLTICVSASAFPLFSLSFSKGWSPRRSGTNAAVRAFRQ